MAYPTSTMPSSRRSSTLSDLVSIDAERLRSIRLLGVTVVGLSGVALLLLVQLTGGTPNPLNHLGYLPVLLSAFIFGLRGGILGAIYVGLLLGPIPPALGLLGAHESLDASVFRAAILLVAGATTGELFDRVRSHLADLQSVAIEVVDRQRDGMVALARGAEAKDTDTGDHVVRVQAISSELARAAGLEAETATSIGWSAMLHDIGKLHVPDRILLKPGPLDRAEWDVMRLHPVWGAEILAQGSGFEVARRIARSHHENFDGSGYPDGLAGDAIPFEARIVRLADSFDAITHGRPYQAARPVDWALREIERHAGTQFDPELARLFIELLERDTDLSSKLRQLRHPDGWERAWTPVPGPFSHLGHEVSR
jgi:putative nucleotidyltransferase with HDIG domain